MRTFGKQLKEISSAVEAGGLLMDFWRRDYCIILFACPTHKNVQVSF
jgi:hypothetical protein